MPRKRKALSDLSNNVNVPTFSSKRLRKSRVAETAAEPFPNTARPSSAVNPATPAVNPATPATSNVNNSFSFDRSTTIFGLQDSSEYQLLNGGVHEIPPVVNGGREATNEFLEGVSQNSGQRDERGSGRKKRRRKKEKGRVHATALPSLPDYMPFESRFPLHEPQVINPLHMNLLSQIVTDSDAR